MDSDSSPFSTNSESLEIQTLLDPTFRLEEQELKNEQPFISKHRVQVLVSPICKLPIEILQEIFIACLPTTHNPVMSRWEPPILLTRICSSWRIVAHATPQLWKSIHIDFLCGENFSSTTVGQHLEAIQEWLTRSVAYPLDISIGASGGHYETELNQLLDEVYDKIIDTLIQFSGRWREVRFAAPYQALGSITSLPPSKVPLLETLSLDCHHQPPPGPAQINFTLRDPQSICGVLKAPNLRDLSLLGCWLIHLNEDVSRLNWSQLTNIVLEGTSLWGECFLSVSGTYKILSLCRNLITFQLEIGRTPGDSEELPLDTTKALISLPFLTRLSVRENTSLSRLFTLLHLPSLNYIEFHTTLYPTQHSSTSLLSLLTRFHNTIHLITDQLFTRQDFIKCLRLCPLLKSLSIRKAYAPPSIPSCKIDDAFLKLFFESSNDEGALCPHLEDFESSSVTAFSENTLLQFVREKNGDNVTGLAKLKRLCVTFNCRPSPLNLNQELELEPYKQAGLVASIVYYCTYSCNH
jgi:hypothetical protein